MAEKHIKRAKGYFLLNKKLLFPQKKVSKLANKDWFLRKTRLPSPQFAKWKTLGFR